MMSWNRRLRALETTYYDWSKIEGINKEYGLVDLTELMQKDFPGNYSVIEVYDPKRGRFALKLEFADPREETMFMLRWS